MLYNLIDINTLNSNTLLDIIGLLSIISAISIIIVSNPMYSILYLIALFINVGLYLYLIGISIMSLLYLLVYVGAIAILFLFILSLFSAVNSIELNEINWFNSNINSNNYPLVLLIIYLLYKQAHKYYENIYNNLIISSSQTNDLDYNISTVYQNNWFNIFDFNHLNQIGYLLYTEYSIIFIVLSIILLFSIVSAIILTYNK
uniref:NADH-ubiquinone oxidoreductase chain 6 n=1 Tax=Cyberlindnera suaveolens TaxID=907738 RepID=S5U528_9ASCO|nr:NADH dehydrogenase subunit 6 [Cyberlindnera suaveolens]